MSDPIDRAAKVIADFNACGHCEGTCGTCRGEAEALDAAGLLVTPEHDRKVIEKFLREEHAPKIRIENPEFIRSLLDKAWREGFKQGGPMHDENLDDPDAHTRSPYRKGETDDRR